MWGSSNFDSAPLRTVFLSQSAWRLSSSCLADMGTDKIKIDREPDYRKVAKNLVEVERPCVTELSALLECMRVRC